MNMSDYSHGALIGPVSVAVILVAFTLATVFYLRSKAFSNLPPGPPVDNLIFGHSIPSYNAFHKFEKWASQYGPVFSLRQGFTTIIVVARYNAAVEIMDRRGAHLADRPTSISAGQTVSGGKRLLLTPVGERFKKMRKALHAHLKPKAVQMYTPLLMKNAKRHILDILEDPNMHHEHAKRFSAAVALALAYGKTAGRYDDPEVVAVNLCLVRLAPTLSLGAWKVDYFPWLRYLPGYLRQLQADHREELKVFRQHLEDVQRVMSRGEPTPPSFTKYLLSQQESLQFSDDQIAYLAAAMFGTDGDPTANAITITIVAAASYPEAQKTVQEELDAVIGRDRAPTFADEDDLPQLQAFILETFRWSPAVGSGGMLLPGFPHRATEDIPWQNYIIPKGATVVGNIWSIGRDPTIFPKPEHFDPQRWLTPEGKIRDDPKVYVFGFGRRVCPGQYLASASLFINTALVLWAFNIHKDATAPTKKFAFVENVNVSFEPRLDKGLEMLKEYGDDSAFVHMSLK